MLMEKRKTFFYVKALQRGRKFEVIILLADATGKNDGDAADMMLQYAHILKKQYQNGGIATRK